MTRTDGVNPSDGGQPRPPTNEDMDRIYDGVLRQFAERLEIRPDEVNVDPKTHPSFYRALMHAAWLDGALALGVNSSDGSSDAEA